jgi:hypothetical protein
MSEQSLRARRVPAALAIVLFIFALAVATPLTAQQSFSATHATTLDASEEPEGVDDQIANGVAIFRLDRAAATLEYRVSVTGLTNIIGAHIHRGEPGESGPVAIPLNITDEMHTTAGTATGLSAEFMDSVEAGLTYVNVHTTEHQAGHIRGQIISIPNAIVPVMTAVGEPHDVIGDSGTGAVVMFIDEETRTARYFLEWSKLTGTARNAHFHIGAPGQSGPPVHTITLPEDTTVLNTSGVWEMSPEHLDALKQGLIYANVHTDVNPAGEIRGAVLVADFYTAAVSAANEVPDRSDSSNGIGTATAIVLRSPVGGFVFVSSVVDGTTGPITMAHVHRGPVGVSGGIIIPLQAGLTPSNWDVQTAPVSVEDIATFAASGMYVNYHTLRFQDGEVRGQLIPGADNLSSASSSVPLALESVATMTAWHDRADGVLSFRVPGTMPTDGTIELYSSIGERVASTPATDAIVRIESRDLGSGAYFARLVSNGRVVASARVAVE